MSKVDRLVKAQIMIDEHKTLDEIRLDKILQNLRKFGGLRCQKRG